MKKKRIESKNKRKKKNHKKKKKPQEKVKNKINIKEEEKINDLNIGIKSYEFTKVNNFHKEKISDNRKEKVEDREKEVKSKSLGKKPITSKIDYKSEKDIQINKIANNRYNLSNSYKNSVINEDKSNKKEEPKKTWRFNVKNRDDNSNEIQKSEEINTKTSEILKQNQKLEQKKYNINKTNIQTENKELYKFGEKEKERIEKEKKEKEKLKRFEEERKEKEKI